MTWAARIITTVSGRKRAVEVRVYSDASHLRAAATRHGRHYSKGYREPQETGAVCHVFEVFASPQHDDGASADLVAVVRLHRGLMGTEVVVHELVHAAEHILAIDKDTALAEHGEMEALAYIVSELTLGAIQLGLIPEGVQ